MLGIREQSIYGKKDYNALCEYIRSVCDEIGIQADIYQSNHEGDIVDRIQAAYEIYDAFVINAAAYTHTSIAIPDAVKAVNVPAVEVHLSNIYEREEFRHISYLKSACIESFYGKGFESYKEAILFLFNKLNRVKNNIN
jgi:3-dehydroquinate dehydratase-2